MRALFLMLCIAAGCASQAQVTTTSVTPPPLKVQVDPSLTMADVQAAIAYVTSMCNASGYDFRGWTATVSPWPVPLPAPQINPFNGQTITVATSYTQFASKHFAFSWSRGKWANNAGTVSVQDVPYEIANAKCGCESGLQPK